MQLKSKILLFLVPLIVAPIASVGWLAYDRLRETSESAILGHVDTLATQTEQRILTFQRTLRANLGLFADSRMLTTYIVTDEANRFELLQPPLLRLFAAYNRAFPDYYEIRVILPDGYEDARYTKEYIPNDTDEEGETPIFQAMHASDQETFVRLFDDPDTGKPALWASQRLVLADPSSIGADAQEPSLRGYLVLTVGLDLLEELARTRIGKVETLYFSDSNGRILFHDDASQIGESAPPEILSLLQQERIARMRIDDHFYTARRITDDLILFTRLTVSEIEAPGRRLGLVVLAITLAAILIIVGSLLVLLNRLLINPIHRLSEAARKIGEGHLDNRIGLTRKDEIGYLGRRFDAMAADLKNSLEQKERAQAEALANREMAIKNLERSDKLKDEFLANTSHELRTPLNGIIGLAESLIDGAAGAVTQEQKKNLLMIMSSGRRLASLVNDILDFSKLKHKNLELKFKAVDMQGSLDLVVTLSRPLIGGKALQVHQQIPEGLPPALADENRLQQILYNLVGNAIKFTREGEVVVFVRQEEVGATPSSPPLDHPDVDPARRLLIGIRDTGVGIPESARASLFQSFEQGDGSSEREFGGTGLGLAVTRQLVELHGGKVWFESEVGKGSTFFFTLPVACTKAEKVALPRYLLEEPQLDEETLEEMTQTALTYAAGAHAFDILIVDDEPVNLQVLSNHLSHLNYRVERAATGMEALEKLESGYRPDLVLLDVMMPKISGFEVCRRLREYLPASELPVLMLTAKNQTRDIVEGFSVGANDYLTKPVSKDELLARVKTHIYLHNVNVALSRFVPHQFLQLLDKESILDVRLGDQVARRMTVLFSDIRSFTTISEELTPQQTYNFINNYLSCMEPIITRRKGFIDKYIGDAIMALFPTSAADAVQGAVEMLFQLDDFNFKRLERGQETIRIGIGLNTGQLMLGTVGGSNRMDGTVISDTVNLASRIEGLTKLYRVPLLISEQTLRALPKDHEHLVRELDTVKVRGKNIPVTVYEVFDADPEESRRLKEKTLAHFEGAVRLFQDNQIDAAQQAFEAVIAAHPDDGAAAVYIERCINANQPLVVNG
jgi:two-component system sensor histidine kinase ChiS